MASEFTDVANQLTETLLTEGKESLKEVSLSIQRFNKRALEEMDTEFNKFVCYFTKEPSPKSPLPKTVTINFPVKIDSNINDNALSNIKTLKDFLAFEIESTINTGNVADNVWRLSIVGSSKALKLKEQPEILSMINNYSDFKIGSLPPEDQGKVMEMYISVMPTPKEFNFDKIAEY